ncbi:MAG TPA: DUF72 domain-containing protein [Candidatus Binatia bacterium]|nr:DUF72 domain-containing protein [Candidatus Binatia bacterium]
MRLAVGTSGYAYKEWKGTFYPEDCKPDGFLRYYSQQFPTVEINNTFYRMPNERILRQWSDEVPADFTFVLKAPMRITHRSRLREVGPDVAYFLKTASSLGSRLGPILVQLPPNFKKDLARLTDFLQLLPEGTRVAFEFRHASWLDDDVYAALRARDAALCIAEADPEESDLRPADVATASWGYLRLRKVQYGEADLTAWVDRVRGRPWRDAFVFFKHEDAGTGPRLARQFAELWDRAGAGATPARAPAREPKPEAARERIPTRAG